MLRRLALVTPISPTRRGNGLAHRARSWQQVLGRLGRVSTVLVPVAGQPSEADAWVVRLATRAPDQRLPRRAAGAPEWLGRAARDQLSADFDLVLALRADVAPFALGLVAGTGTRLVVDLDDDDADFHASRGDLSESDRYRRLIQEVLDRADLCTAAVGRDGVAAVPNSWPVRSTTARAQQPAGAHVLMVGNLDYAPNREGAAWFLEQVLPLVTADVPQVSFAVAGPGSEALGQHGLGFVQDLEPEYARAALAVVPLMHGSGSRIKALEAFAHGVPVVGTTLGLAGLGLVSGSECMLADDAPGLAAAVVRVLTEPGLAQALGAKGRSTVEARFDAEPVHERARALLRPLLATPRPPGLLRPAPGLLLRTVDDGVVATDATAAFAHRITGAAAAVLALTEGPASRADLVALLVAEAGTSSMEAERWVAQGSGDLLRAGLLVESRQQLERL